MSCPRLHYALLPFLMLLWLAGGQAAAQQTAAQTFAHQGLSRDAQRYEAQVKAVYGPLVQGKRAENERSAGAKALASANDARAAMRHFASAVALAPNDAEAWLGLARALMAIRPAPQGSERYNLPVNASAAAFISYQRATAPDAKARALATLSEALKRRSFWRPAIDALKTSLALQDNADVRKTFEALRAEHGFRVMDYKVENEASTPRVCIQFSELLKKGISNLSKFVTVDGRDAESIASESRQLCIDDLAHGKRYEIGLRAGLPSAIGETLLKPSIIPVYVRDRQPSVRFSGRNYVLPSRGQQGIPVLSINARRIAIEIYRIPDRNLNSVLGQNGDFLTQLSGYEAARLGEQHGQKIYSGELAVSPKLNTEVTTAVPVGDAVKKLQPGVYAMMARALDSKESGGRGDSATQWFIVSDLGLTAFTGTDGLHIFVRSLTTTEPVTNVQVKLVARNNEELGSAKADGAGYARFEPGLVRGEGGMQPMMVIAQSSAGQYAFLDLTNSAFDLSDRGVKGREKPGALDGYIYADRGIYRPGDTVHLNALVRDAAGKGAPVPMTMIVVRPDGVEHIRSVLPDQGLGGREMALPLSASVMTGTWRVRLHADPKADAVASSAFLVEDFVPERLELSLKPAATSLSPQLPGVVNVSGRYLYGPPAAGLAVEAEVIVKASGQGLEAYPGYHFGLAGERISPVRKRLEAVPRTNDKGELALEVTLPAIPRTARPLSADVLVTLAEPGGRTIERKVSLPVDPGLPRIGIRPQFKDSRLAENEEANFELVLLDEAGRRFGGKRLEWTLYRLERSWQWYRRDSSWNYDAVTLTRKVATGQVDSQTDTPARIAARTGWGQYRLEVATTEAGGPAASYVFDAGWYGGENADSPEFLEVGLDKPGYKPGETAKLKVATRDKGKLLVTVLGNGLLLHRAVDLPKGGGEVPIPVGKDWGPGAYVTATFYRALDEKARRMPSRAIGLKWLSIDKSESAIKVALSVPQKVGSGTKLSVPIKLEDHGRGEEARVTVAVVDVGILNLTRFKSPDPLGWFYAQTRLGVEIRDLYGRLIDGMRAERGALRSGGDADGGGLSMSGNPPVEKLLALHSGIVKVAADGTAKVEFDLPDFNGTARIMAVAWSATRIGAASQDVLIRDPVALTVSAPRFLTLGDEARLDLSLHNVEGATGGYRLSVERGGEAKPATVAGRDLQLAQEQRKSERITLKPTTIGLVSYDVRLTGPGGVDVKRKLTFDVKAPGGDIKRVTVASLAPQTGTVTITPDLIANMIPARTLVNVSAGPLAAFDVPGLLAQLDRYPYGCAEQTTSRALPLLYANELGSEVGAVVDKALKERVQVAVDRVFEMQDSSGAFGTWGPGSADMWLTAYVTDFLTRAKEAGYLVRAQPFTSALDRLQSYISYAQDFQKGGEDRAYALYVLARNGRAPAGELRYYVDTRLDRFGTSLAKAQLGAALAMLGDRERAETAFRAALAHASQANDGAREDYGSSLRDNAALVTLASEVSMMKSEAPRLADVIAKAFRAREFTSTQEQAWMLLAARALSEQARNTQLTINGTPHVGALARRVTASEIAAGKLTIGNVGDNPVDAVVSVVGLAATPEPATAKGFSIERNYYSLDGRKIEMKSAAGGEGSVQQNDRMVVVVKVTASEKGGRILVVDRLPAGLEIDNPRLVDSASLKSLSWLNTNVKPEHLEFRDDKFVAAFNFHGSRGRNSAPQDSASVAYIVRAVTPGVFVHPAASVEDMYRPQRYARTAAGRLTVQPKQ